MVKKGKIHYWAWTYLPFEYLAYFYALSWTDEGAIFHNLKLDSAFNVQFIYRKSVKHHYSMGKIYGCIKENKLFFPVSSRYISHTTLQFCEPAHEYERVDFSQMATISQHVPERWHDSIGTKSQKSREKTYSYSTGH